MAAAQLRSSEPKVVLFQQTIEALRLLNLSIARVYRNSCTKALHLTFLNLQGIYMFYASANDAEVVA